MKITHLNSTPNAYKMQKTVKFDKSLHNSVKRLVAAHFFSMKYVYLRMNISINSAFIS